VTQIEYYSNFKNYCSKKFSSIKANFYNYNNIINYHYKPGSKNDNYQLFDNDLLFIGNYSNLEYQICENKSWQQTSIFQKQVVVYPEPVWENLIKLLTFKKDKIYYYFSYDQFNIGN
jgi:hypothetical protein